LYYTSDCKHFTVNIVSKSILIWNNDHMRDIVLFSGISEEAMQWSQSRLTRRKTFAGIGKRKERMYYLLLDIWFML
jgi:hypothetical protein